MPEKLDLKLVVLLSRVHDKALISDFGATQQQIDDARLSLGIEEPRCRVDSMTFALAWQGSKSVAEVALRTGLTRADAMARMAELRKRGIPLKKLPTAKEEFWRAIKDAVALTDRG